MKKTKEYRKIIDKLIKESFPILKNRKIIITEAPTGKYSAGVLRLFGFYFIFVGKNVIKYSKQSKIGLFAHELSHFERYIQRSFLKNISIGLVYWVPFFRKVRVQEERETDILAIKKGYGKQLLALKTINNKIDQYYLSPKEIKLYITKCQKQKK